MAMPAMSALIDYLNYLCIDSVWAWAFLQFAATGFRIVDTGMKVLWANEHRDDLSSAIDAEVRGWT